MRPKSIDGHILDFLPELPKGQSIFVSVQPKNVLNRAKEKGIKVKTTIVVVVEPYGTTETVRSYKITKVTRI